MLKHTHKIHNVTWVYAILVKLLVGVAQVIFQCLFAMFFEGAKKLLSGILHLEDSIDDLLDVSFGFT